MAKGAIIKYNIPWFNPCAGFSPSCEAVFVQTEHCAFTALVWTAIQKARISIMEKNFMQCSKVTKQSVSGLNCLTEIFKKAVVKTQTCFYFASKWVSTC